MLKTDICSFLYQILFSYAGKAVSKQQELSSVKLSDWDNCVLRKKRGKQRNCWEKEAHYFKAFLMYLLSLDMLELHT